MPGPHDSPSRDAGRGVVVLEPCKGLPGYISSSWEAPSHNVCIGGGGGSRFRVGAGLSKDNGRGESAPLSLPRLKA